MELDAPHIIVSLIFSAIGFVYFSYGRKQTVVPMIAAGVALMGYTYFVSSLAWSIVIGIALTAAPFIWR